MFERKGMNLQWFAQDPEGDTPTEAREDGAPAQRLEEQDPSQELETLRQEVARLKAEAARAALRDTAAGLLKEYKLEATPEGVDLVLGEDEAQTKAKVAQLERYVKARLQAAERTRATGRTPQSYGGGENSPKTAFRQKLDKYQNRKG